MKVHIQIQGDDFNYEDDITQVLAGWLIAKIGLVKAFREERAAQGVFTKTEHEIIRDHLS